MGLLKAAVGITHKHSEEVGTTAGANISEDISLTGGICVSPDTQTGKIQRR